MVPKEVNFFSRAEPFSLPSDLPLIIALGILYRPSAPTAITT